MKTTKLFPQVVVAVFGIAVFITTASAQTVRTWDGSTSGNWGTTSNWTPDGATFNNVTDLTFQGGAGALTSNFFGGSNRTMRSLTYTSTLTGNVNHSLANTFNGTIARNLDFEADSGAASITVQSGSSANITIGGGIGVQGSIQLRSNLDITNNGTGILNLNRPINGVPSTTARTVNISGTGVTIFSVNNGYQGTTNVNGGTLLLNGSNNAANNFSVASGAVIGGSGTINGNLNLASGALLAFDTATTLTLGGTLTLDSSFGVASLRNTSGAAVDWSLVGDGTYTLLDTTFSFNAGNISNFGIANAFDIGGGRSAYFQNGSLDLVVVPEPSSWALMAVGLTVLVVFRRRRAV